MSNWGYDDNDNTQAGNAQDGPKALRDAYDRLKEQNDELNRKLTSFLEDQQKQKVGQVFEALGVPQAQSLYQGEADPVKIEAWVNDMKSAFGGAPQVAPATTTETPQAQMSSAEMHQYQMMLQAGQNEAPLGNFEAAQAGLGSAGSIDDIVAAMTK